MFFWVIIIGFGLLMYDFLTTGHKLESQIKKARAERDYAEALLHQERNNAVDNQNFDWYVARWPSPSRHFEFRLVSREVPKYFAKKNIKRINESRYMEEISDRLSEMGMYYSNFFGIKLDPSIHRYPTGKNKCKIEIYGKKDGTLTESDRQEISYIFCDLIDDFEYLDFKFE